MTTNQTIDGVRRELLQKIADGGYCHQGLMDELRALLDASLTDEGEKPAAQLQWQPVAYDIESAARKLAECMDYSWTHMPEQGRAAMREYVVAIVGAALSGNADQSAPVAVVLPERREPTQDNPYLSDADHEWNACLDEATRLNAKSR